MLFVARHLKPASPTRVLETHVEDEEDGGGNERLVQITLDRNQRIVKIVVLAPHYMVEARNLVRLIGLQEAFLGSLVNKYENGKIICFLDYFRKESIRVLFDHRFNRLLTQLTEEIVSDTSTRTITNQVRDILQSHQESTQQDSKSNDDGLYTSVILTRNKLIGIGGKSLSSELRKKYAEMTFTLLRDNRVV